MLRPSLLAIALGAATAAAQSVPADLATLAAKAGIDRPIVAWCRGEFRSGQTGAYAVAVAESPRGGRYLVLAPDGTSTELATFTDGADLQCYTPAGARRLSRSVRDSGMHGRVAPTFPTTVVCGFVESTRAVCWQRSPTTGSFVTVGGWTT